MKKYFSGILLILVALAFLYVITMDNNLKNDNCDEGINIYHEPFEDGISFHTIGDVPVCFNGEERYKIDIDISAIFRGKAGFGGICFGIGQKSHKLMREHHLKPDNESLRYYELDESSEDNRVFHVEWKMKESEEYSDLIEVEFTWAVGEAFNS